MPSAREPKLTGVSGTGVSTWTSVTATAEARPIRMSSAATSAQKYRGPPGVRRSIRAMNHRRCTSPMMPRATAAKTLIRIRIPKGVKRFSSVPTVACARRKPEPVSRTKAISARLE